MAADDFAEKKKKQKRPNNPPKLLVDEKVEVRSIDEGSLGSWHSAVVISVKNRARDVRYDSLLCDDGSQKLIEEIDVNPVVDGITPVGKRRLFYRGLIRPLPPPFDFNRLSMHYGQCVDAYYQEAWWEGVVFDHENDSEFRSIFFPDIGDLLHIRVDDLRITQDWDEFTQEWNPRGNWLFLELIEQFKQENLIHVSAREVWYELSEKEGFKKLKEWTNSSTRRDIWESLVMEVIDDHSKLAAEMFVGEVSESMLRGDFECRLRKSDAADCIEVNTVPLVAEEEIHVDDPLAKSKRSEISLPRSSNSGLLVEGLPSALSINYEKSSRLQNSNQIRDDSDFSISDNPVEINVVDECQSAGCNIDLVPEVEICRDSACKSETTHEESPCSAQSIVPCNAATAVGEGNMSKDLDIVSKESTGDRRKKRKWEIAGTDIVPEAEFCPRIVRNYLSKSNSNNHKDNSSLQLSLRKHLAYLGWKIEVHREERSTRMRYTSPKGKSYMSLVTVCQDWNMAQSKLRCTDHCKKTKACAPPLSHALISSSPRDIIEPANFPETVKCCAKLIGSGEKSNKTAWPKNATPRDLQDKARRHLRASGWSIWINEAGKKEAFNYTSPSGKTYSSLLTACKAYTDGEVNNGVGVALISEPRQNIDVSDEANDKVIASERLPSNVSMELVEFGRVAVGEHHNEGAAGGSPLTFCNSLVQRKGRETAYSQKKKEKKQLVSAEASDGMDDDYFEQCSKRAARQLDSSSSFRSPMTVLSWLVDNDVVLPRTKVYYLGRKVCASIKEGLITREGIKCNCCKIVFSLSKFQVHAGSTHEYDRPAANIYLEDGRSLLSCQSQLRNRLGLKSMLTPSPQPKRRTTNDSICSVCHFGGLLVLCDHCPSSFHRECLGLTDVPDGEWFCPQCCCRICGNNKFNLGTKQIMKGSTLNCHQCDRRYHVGCLLKQGDAKIDSYSEGKWFCNIKCEQIFLGLHKLLEKPVVVGDGNLTWTLLKYIPGNDDLDDYGMEPSVETYSKLNLVVSVMHECFEPMNEPGTRRDIVEDVIFSRGSDLSRLNFQGFYTVLLSRDDELITVAAVRVHGEKVAEVPLVGTRFQYRKLGMCRFLMNELEKKLMELGVERLVMPAAPSVLSTWIGSFGFSKISETERLNLCSYSFLDFQGSVMCQKILTVPAQKIKTLQNIHDGVGGTTDVSSDKNSTSSEVSQAEQTKDVETAYQGTADSAVVGNANTGTGTLPLVLRVSQRYAENRHPVEVLVEEGVGLKKSDSTKQREFFKCYKRRRIL